MRNVNVGWVWSKVLFHERTCRWGPFWRPTNLKHRLGTLIVLLLVECIKWTPSKGGSTAIGPCRWRLSIESWEEVGHPGAGMCDRSCLENNEVMFVFGPSRLPEEFVLVYHGELVWLSSAVLLTMIFVCVAWVAWVGWSYYYGGSLWKNSFIFAIMWVFQKWNNQPSLAFTTQCMCYKIQGDD